MKILVLNGSPRTNGNTSALVSAFKEGAESKGHEVEAIQVGAMKINGCLGCEYCHTKGGGKCIQQDEMNEVYPAIAEADMIVFASAVYYMSFTGQLQSVITRFYASGKPAAKKYAMILSSGSDGVYNALISQYKDIVGFFGAEDMGIKTVFGENNKSEEALAQMKAFGESL